VTLALKVKGCLLSTSVKSSGAVLLENFPAGSRKLSRLASLPSVILPASILA
jgi:hypothetical protein